MNNDQTAIPLNSGIYSVQQAANRLKLGYSQIQNFLKKNKDFTDKYCTNLAKNGNKNYWAIKEEGLHVLNEKLMRKRNLFSEPAIEERVFILEEKVQEILDKLNSLTTKNQNGSNNSN